LAVGGLAGLMTGLLLSLRLPVRFRRYAPVKGTLEVRFDNPEVAAGFLASRDAGPPGDNETREKAEEESPAKGPGHEMTPNGRNRGRVSCYPDPAAGGQVRSVSGALCPSQSVDRDGLAASTLVSRRASDHARPHPVWKTASLTRRLPPPAAPVPFPL